MPYADNSSLPIPLRRHLPEHAQSLYREAFNHASDEYAAQKGRREEIAHRVAWSAVKKRFVKDATGMWRPIVASV
jgi:cation transport regulator